MEQEYKKSQTHRDREALSPHSAAAPTTGEAGLLTSNRPRRPTAETRPAIPTFAPAMDAPATAPPRPFGDATVRDVAAAVPNAVVVNPPPTREELNDLLSKLDERKLVEISIPLYMEDSHRLGMKPADRDAAVESLTHRLSFAKVTDIGALLITAEAIVDPDMSVETKGKLAAMIEEHLDWNPENSKLWEAALEVQSFKKLGNTELCEKAEQELRSEIRRRGGKTD